MSKLYAKRNPMEQGEHYTKHVMAMTGEGLHDKSDIAAELAHRDIQIEALKAENERLKKPTSIMLNRGGDALVEKAQTVLPDKWDGIRDVVGAVYNAMVKQALGDSYESP